MTPANRPSPLAPGKPPAGVAEFLDRLRTKTPAGPTPSRGRLIFALDATASREPAWDRACHIQGEMFEATAALGRLEIQLIYYRGFLECKASRWMTTAADLHRVMRSVLCVGGHTQIARVLSHSIAEAQRHKVNALVFVGDAMEEKLDDLCRPAGELGSLSVPVFLFHEGHDPVAEVAFKQIASLSGGAYLAFDLASIDRLKQLLGAIAVYATGGHAALEAYGAKKGVEVLRIAAQLRGGGP